jgi:uncharacterized RDD family membrane protein YckC
MTECPKCYSLNSVGEKYCRECKFNLSYKLIEEPVCPVCLTTYKKGDLFCEKDGQALVDQRELIYSCATCGKTYSESVKFCPVDGGKVVPCLQNGNEIFQPVNQYQFIKASLGKRFGASLLDGLLVLLLMLPALFCMLIGIQGINYRKELYGLLLILAAVVLYFLPLLYSLLKDGFGQGQSWGKKALGIQVIQEETLEVCSYKASFKRNGIMTLLNFIPFVGAFIEPIVLISSEDSKRLGDNVAKTIVINKR